MARTPGAGDALFENRREYRVTARAGCRNEDRDITLSRRVVEERLVAGAVHSMDRDPGRTRVLYPHSRVARVTGIPVDAERNHSVPLRE